MARSGVCVCGSLIRAIGTTASSAPGSSPREGKGPGRRGGDRNLPYGHASATGAAAVETLVDPWRLPKRRRAARRRSARRARLRYSGAARLGAIQRVRTGAAAAGTAAPATESWQSRTIALSPRARTLCFGALMRKCGRGRSRRGSNARARTWRGPAGGADCETEVRWSSPRLLASL